MSTVSRRIDMVGFISTHNCNPNGDPNEGNRPRMTFDGRGIMTDVCIKSMIRSRVALLHGQEEGYDIFIKADDVSLETKAKDVIAKVLDEHGMSADDLKKEPDSVMKEAMSAAYFDIRSFGGVINTLVKEKYCDGKITGPVQVSFAESLDEIMPEELVITRKSVATEAEIKEKSNTMGKKWIVPYAVYRFEVHISGALAEKTGFSEKDLEILKNAIFNMYETGYTSSKTGMSVDRLYIFEHKSKYGDCRFSQLNNAVQATMSDDHLSYSIDFDSTVIPDSVKVEVME